MDVIDVRQMEQTIARCRVVLSVAAFAVVYIDPEIPLMSRWIPWRSGSFAMDPRTMAVMAAHLGYSVLVYVAAQRWRLAPALASRTIWADVAFAVIIATMTEGLTSPSYPFFAFAVLTAGVRSGLRLAMIVTAVSLGLYLCLIVVTMRRGADVYIMRPLYLGITGYLVGYLGQRSLELQERMRRLEVDAQRHRIGRDLHDGYAQALAGITLRLEGTRRMLVTDPAAGEALGELTDLQESVKREYDELRRYARSLAGLESTPAAGSEGGAIRLTLHADVTASAELVDHVLGIAREGLANVRRHARATTARIDIRGHGPHVRIDIDDDGVGFHGDAAPWTIASRVKDIGGRLQIDGAAGRGAHVSITLPNG